jgi:hypothetical protein
LSQIGHLRREGTGGGPERPTAVAESLGRVGRVKRPLASRAVGNDHSAFSSSEMTASTSSRSRVGTAITMEARRFRMTWRCSTSASIEARTSRNILVSCAAWISSSPMTHSVCHPSRNSKSFLAVWTPHSKYCEALRFLVTLREVETHLTPGLAPQVGQACIRSRRTRSCSRVNGSVAAFSSICGHLSGGAGPQRGAGVRGTGCPKST